jgi:hypothetical protein
MGHLVQVNPTGATTDQFRGSPLTVEVMTRPGKDLGVQLMGNLSHPRGQIAMFRTPNPVPEHPAWFMTYAALGDWLDKSAPAGMFVTVNCWDDFNPSSTSSMREVNLVYSNPRYFRRILGEDPSPAVPVGRWLYQAGLFTSHSPDRNALGEKWARAVGGDRPP